MFLLVVFFLSKKDGGTVRCLYLDIIRGQTVVAFSKSGVQFQEYSTSLKIPKLKWNTNVADDR